MALFNLKKYKQSGRGQSGHRAPVTEARLECFRFLPPSREAALFVTHSPDGHLRPHVPTYLSALAENGIDVYLIVATDCKLSSSHFRGLDFLSGLYVRQNVGFDFAAWSHILRVQPLMYHVEVLYLLNDSVIGPNNRQTFHDLLERIRTGTSAIYGMTDDYEKGWHLQSYFLAVKRTASLSSTFRSFMNEIVSETTKEMVIDRYEVTFATKMRNAGYRAEALFPSNLPRNPTLYRWKHLIEEGFPFIKVQVLRDELPGVDRTGWREFLEKHGFNVTVVDQLLGSRIHPEHVTPNQLARSKLRIWELPLGQFKCKNFTRSCWEKRQGKLIRSIKKRLDRSIE